MIRHDARDNTHRARRGSSPRTTAVAVIAAALRRGASGHVSSRILLAREPISSVYQQ